MMMLFVQEMVWNIMHDVDLETAKATTLEKRVSRKLQEFPFRDGKSSKNSRDKFLAETTN